MRKIGSAGNEVQLADISHWWSGLENLIISNNKYLCKGSQLLNSKSRNIKSAQHRTIGTLPHFTFTAVFLLLYKSEFKIRFWLDDLYNWQIFFCPLNVKCLLLSVNWERNIGTKHKERKMSWLYDETKSIYLTKTRSNVLTVLHMVTRVWNLK